MRKYFIFGILIVLLLLLFIFGSRFLTLYNLSSAATSPFFFLIVVFAAFVDSLNPCAFSILIITVGFLLSLGRSRRDILFIGLFYILGIFLVYSLIGLGVLKTLQFFDTPRFMAKVGALFLIAWGTIDVLSSLFPKFPITLKIPNIAHTYIARLMSKASLPAAFALGLFVGLCEFPCTGGPYLVILGLLHDATTFVSGFGYLILYNLIFVFPLFVILFLTNNKQVVEKMEAFKKNNVRRFSVATGSAMILLGLLLLIFY